MGLDMTLENIVQILTRVPTVRADFFHQIKFDILPLKIISPHFTKLI